MMLVIGSLIGGATALTVTGLARKILFGITLEQSPGRLRAGGGDPWSDRSSRR